jgi:hypothetical protein
MSNTAAQKNVAQGGGGSGQSVNGLNDLVRDLGKWRGTQEAGINFIVISVSSALPASKRAPPLVEQIKDSVLAQSI